MTHHSYHVENHYTERSGWLRAAVLGANDGIISVTSLVIGMATTGVSEHTVLMSGVAGLIAGAVSMAAGEYISVKSQQDIEEADLKMEAKALHQYPEQELKELAHIYETRGLEPSLALEVATKLTAHDALATHARDEIGIVEENGANPIQAAFASAVAFSFGALFPLMALLVLSKTWEIAITGIVALAILGGCASYGAGSPIFRGVVRVVVWGVFAMGFSAWVGSLFQVSIY